MRILSRLMVVTMLAVVAGCAGEDASSGAAAASGSGAAAQPSPAVSGDAQAPADPQARPVPGTASPATAPATGAALGGRTGELLHPDESAMVFLYHDLAGIPIALDPMVEEDRRVHFAEPANKPAMRQTVRTELQAAIDAVRDVGFIRLTTDGKLSKYDPGYGEFTIGALSPSSMFSFSAYRQKVTLKLGNGRQAQVWRVPPDEAQAVSDKLDNWGATSLDMLLRVKSVQPAPGGGTIVADVAEFELRETRTNSTLARVRVDPP